MADRPLRINNSTPKSLIEMSDSEMDYAAHIILERFSQDTTSTGHITTNSGHTHIGSFVDTTRQANTGAHPVGTAVNSTTYAFYQNLNTVTESLVRPVKFSANAVRESDDTDLADRIIDRAFDRLVAGGVGSYALQPAAPTSGTWTSVRTINNQIRTASGLTTATTTTLWKRTVENTPTANRPIKVNNNGSLQEMTDADIETLYKRFQNRIVASGRGQYRIATNAPSGGTWVRLGTAFTDTRRQVANQNYSGTYSTPYAGTYATPYAGTYTGYYSASYVRYYSGRIYGYYAGSRAKSYTGYYNRNFTGYYNRNFTGTYTGLTIQTTSENVSTISLWVRTA